MDFARFNQGKIRQAGSVEQRYLNIDLILGKKHANVSLGLSPNHSANRHLIDQQIKTLRAKIEHSDEDPYLMVKESIENSESIAQDHLKDSRDMVSSIITRSEGLDLVGCYLQGPIYKGFFNSQGQVNWFSKSSFVLDMSVYHSGDRAIKQRYADVRFDEGALEQRIESAKVGLKLFDRAPVSLNPGSYRVYFSPSAVHEMLSLINWGGFSKKSLEVKNSPLRLLYDQQKQLSPDFSLSENIASGIGCNFQSQGFIKPGHLSLIEDGCLQRALISPKTAKEYHLLHNGADDSEMMCSMDMKEGQLLEGDILPTLEEGLVVNDLWYLNFSDHQHGCLTGMTRFLCYTVKDKKPVAPFSVMRFDDSIYRIFGQNLKHLTKKRELIIDSETYDERSTSCATVPGIIAENVRFTL